jgi:hypothetical protein
MAFILRATVPVDRLPPPDALLREASDRLQAEIRLDEPTESLRRRGRRDISWAPWPRAALGFYVPGASTRGADVQIEPAGGNVEVRVIQAVLCTWTDWRLGLALAAVLGRHGDGSLRVDGEGRFEASGLQMHFEDDDERWLLEIASGTAAVRAAVEDERRTVKIGGPAGVAAIGPRTWPDIARDGPDEELPLRLVERIQASIEARGFESFHKANPLCLDGRQGREVVACVLPPERATLLREPEYVLLGDDLERSVGAELFLLPFSRMEEAFPGVLSWLDERSCGVPALALSSWPQTLARVRPLLVPLAELLDAEPPEVVAGAAPAAGGPTIDSDAWRRYLPAAQTMPAAAAVAPAEAHPAPSRPWWRFWRGRA